MDLSTLGTQPISEEKPAGADARYDRVYDELQAEVDKLSSPAAAGSIDWEMVVRHAADILQNTSKDLLAASYLAVALIHTRGNEGFTVGLNLYCEMIATFWEELFPQKTRARLRSLEWWLEKTTAALKQIEDLSFPPDQFILINENMAKLHVFLNEHLENCPSLAPINAFFDELSTDPAATQPTETPERLLEETIEDESAGATVNAWQSRLIAPSPEQFRQLTSRQEADQALNDGLLMTSQASSYLWQHDLASPQVFRLNRKTAWNAVDELPPADNGRTKIPPPPSKISVLLIELRNSGDAEAMLKAAETRQTEYIFWLDLSHFTAEALTRLGGGFQKALDAVRQETAFLLHRLPGLEELAFADGTPFAAPDTRQWLRHIAFPGVPSDASPTSAASMTVNAEAEGEIELKMEEMRQLVVNGKLLQAMEAVQRELDGCSSRRENLLWRLSLSRMLVGIGKPELALPHLEQVQDDIARYALEQYEPSLALVGFRLAWLALDRLTEPRFKDRAQEVLHRIGRLDMPEMVRLAKTTTNTSKKVKPQSR